MCQHQVGQLDLWKNVAYNKAWNHLHFCELKEACVQFKIALQHPLMSEEHIRELIATCVYWETRLQPKELSSLLDLSHSQNDFFSEFLDDFNGYTFPKGTKEFQKSLLQFLGKQLKREKGLHQEDVQIFLNLLLKRKLYKTASEMLLRLVKEHPQNPDFLYGLAEAQWLNNEKTNARKNYVRAILRWPDQKFIDRICDEQALRFLDMYGLETTPVCYALAYGIPFIENIQQIVPVTKKHAKALRCYDLIQQAKQATRNGKSNLEFRKEIKELNPKFFEGFGGKI